MFMSMAHRHSTYHLAMILSALTVFVKDETRARINFCYSNNS